MCYHIQLAALLEAPTSFRVSKMRDKYWLWLIRKFDLFSILIASCKKKTNTFNAALDADFIIYHACMMKRNQLLEQTYESLLILTLHHMTIHQQIIIS